MLKVNIDVSGLHSQKLTGVGVYVWNLILALQKRNDVQLSASFKISRIKHIKTLKDKIKLPFTLPSIPTISKFLPKPYTLFHGPDYWVPTIKSVKKVVTIHDFSVFHDGLWGKEFADNSRKVLHSLFEKAKPDQIIVVSDFIKKELINLFPAYENKVTTIYHGVDHFVSDPDIIRPFEFPYIACVGTIERRKNVLNLAKAFRNMNARFPELKLVLIGGATGFMGKEILEEIVKIKNVFYLDYVSKETMQGVIKHAEFVAYPSEYEGFGFPILEAMYLGAPVLTSNFGAMKEIAGGNAFTSNTLDIESLASDLENFLENKTLRTELKAQGLEHVKLFTWQKTAQQTIEVYKKALL